MTAVTQPKMKMLALALITPYWRNPRDIDQDAVDAVAKSISEYNFNSPIVVDGNNVIIAGHTRYKAALQLGLDKVPVIVTDLSEEKAKAYRIADNKSAEFATWNMDRLIAELREVSDSEGMQTFFGDLDLDSLLQETATIEMPTINTINAVQARMDTKFQEASVASKGDYVEVICPHCASVFSVTKSEVLRRAGAQAAQEAGQAAA